MCKPSLPATPKFRQSIRQESRGAARSAPSRQSQIQRSNGGSPETRKISASATLGRPYLRHPRHHRRDRGLWLTPGRQAGASPAGNCEWAARPESIQWRTCHSLSGPPVSLRHCVWCRWCVPRGKPRPSFLGAECCRFRCSLRSGRLFLHEPNCCAALRCRPSTLFSSADDCRSDYPHLLRGAAHIAHRAPFLDLTSVSRTWRGRRVQQLIRLELSPQLHLDSLPGARPSIPQSANSEPSTTRTP